MEQMYLVEIFIDTVTIFVTEEETSTANKKLIIKIKFGPKVQFILKEGQLAVNEETTDDVIECDEQGHRKWSRTIRVGKSYLFPSYPDTLLMILSKFPLEIEVWNDDEQEEEIFVGIGTMHWETQFFHMLKETSDACRLHEPLSIKQMTPLFAECCCKQCGEISFILRLSALGESIMTEFQQLMKDPESFVFRTNRAPSMFQCKRVEGDDPNFCMVGSLYETTTLEDPDIINNAKNKIEVCTELQSCGMDKKQDGAVCQHKKDEEPKKKSYPISKIRMGDITGPCGNNNCPLAHKVKTYIRNLESYKKQTEGEDMEMKDKGKATSKVCGSCSCKDDKHHREECSEKQGKKSPCKGCGGQTQTGETCEDKKKKLMATGSKTEVQNDGTCADKNKKPGGPDNKPQINYVLGLTKVPDFKTLIYGQDFFVENVTTKYDYINAKLQSSNQVQSSGGCGCRKHITAPLQTPVVDPQNYPNIVPPESKSSTRSMGANNQLIYNVDIRDSRRKIEVYNCTEIPDEKDCKCNPPKPTPPCRTFDCDCIAEMGNIAARKAHKPFCPSYKHKENCPVTMMQEDEEKKKAEEDEDEAEPLPYGLPPVKLGPCPVLGKPCTYPDGFTRMYKATALPPQPPSYSEAGKVCCSKEYERIKKAIKDYMKNDKEADFRCVNKFNVDTERRCCDKEQRLLALMGKGCCGSHKMAIQEKFKEDTNK